MNSKTKSYTALITGGTDGIGKATAIALAQKGFSVHILGVSKERGVAALEQLKSINAQANHQLYLCDLSQLEEVNTFLENYIAHYDTLDVLVLNAGIYPKEHRLSADGIDRTFSIGYVSRYVFSVQLNPLLLKSDLKKVVHVNGSVMGRIYYDQLSAPRYSAIKSVWQNSVGSALLVHNWQAFSKTAVAHTHWNPGIVNTQTVKSQPYIVQLLSKLMGMMSAEKAGGLLANFIVNTNAKDAAAKFYTKGKMSKTPAKLQKSPTMFNDLINFSEAFTQLKMKPQKTFKQMNG